MLYTSTKLMLFFRNSWGEWNHNFTLCLDCNLDFSLTIGNLETSPSSVENCTFLEASSWSLKCCPLGLHDGPWSSKNYPYLQLSNVLVSNVLITTQTSTGTLARAVQFTSLSWKQRDKACFENSMRFQVYKETCVRNGNGSDFPIAHKNL